MFTLKKESRRVICAFLTAALLCSDVGLTVYAAEAAEQGMLIEMAKEGPREETQAEDAQTEEPSAGDSQADGAKKEEGELDETLSEDGQSEDIPSEETLKNEEAGENPGGGDAETGAAQEKPAEEEGTSEQKPDVEEDECADDIPAENDADEEETVSENDAEVEETVSENDVVVEENLLAADRTYGNITWEIDENGKLTITGTGNFNDSIDYYRRAPWYERRDEVKTAEVNVTGMTNASFMFNNCSNLTSLDVSNFNTSQVTDMHDMFSGCSNLTSLDVSNFDTSQVTDMTHMFSDCSNLTNLDVSNLDTSQVTNMKYMFGSCSSLTSLNVSSFDTSQVTDMCGMFMDCSSLMSVDVSNLDTSRVTDMSQMFASCSSLTSLDVSSFDTSRVRNMDRMFSGCSSLTSLDTSNFDTSQVTGMDQMFASCSSLMSLDVSNFDTSQVTGMDQMFASCSSLMSLDVSNFDTSQVTGMRQMFINCSNLKNLDVSNFNTSQVTNMDGMFHGCSSLTSLDVSNFDTSQVTNMDGMFSDCSNLASLNISNFDTSQVTDMGYMFSDCSNLTSLNVSNFDTSQVTDMDYMFYDCSNLTSLDVNNFNTSQVTNMDRMFYDCSSLTSLDVGNFDMSQVTNMDCMFFCCSSLTSLDVGNFDTSQVTDMDYMFYDCSNLTSLDVNNFNTSQVTNMDQMFFRCSSLTSLDVGNFDTSQVTNMHEMFYGCSSLNSLDISNFETSRVTNMHAMFSNCSNLASLDVSNLDTSQVTDMGYMFQGCSNLTSLDVSNLDTSQVTDMGYMFQGCSNLTSLNVSNFNTGQVTAMIGMFSDCSNLISLDVSRFNTSLLDDMGNMFYCCSSLTSVDVSHFDTSQVTDMSGMFLGCNSLMSVDVSNFDTSRVTNIHDMFLGCSSLTSVDVSNFDTSQVKDMGRMFDGCSNLTSLDVSKFDTNQVVDMGSMFCDCSNLMSLDVSKFNTGNVNSMHFMFHGCSNLTNLDVSNFNTGRVEDMGGMFAGCSNLMSLDVSNFDTNQVVDMGHMFFGCSNLTSLNVSNFETSQVIYMSGMFWDCSNLTSLNVSNFETSQVTDMNSMFSNCSNLTSLNVSNFDTSHVTDVGYMFSGCIHLTNLDLSSFNFSNITTADGLLGLQSETLYNELQSIHTPYNLKLSVELPTGTWYQPDGTSITELPQNLDHSILITKGEPSKEIPIESITIGEKSLSLKTGESKKLTWRVTPENATFPAITWASSDTKIAEVGNGTVTAVSAGKCTVTVSAGDKEASCEVTVVSDTPVDPTDPSEDVAAPEATPESGRQLTAGSKVTLTCGTAGAEIYYTTGASEKELAEPTEASARYTEPIAIHKDMYIRAVAIKGGNCSRTVTFYYTVLTAEAQVMKPYAVPGQGIVETGTKIELKSDTPDAVIYYVTGKNPDMLGEVPDDDRYKYTAPIEITEDTVIKAVAEKDGMEDSDAAVFVYRVNTVINKPTAAPISGTVNQGSYISLTADSDANIYYTTDTSDPVVSGTAKLYETKIRVDGTAGSVITIKAAAEKKGIYSETVTFTYTVSENKEKGLRVMLAGGEEYTYTGSAITPAVIVTNNGEVLAEGADYTVRYNNNVKAAKKDDSKAPKVIIKGKGNLTKSTSVTFTIRQKDIGDEEMVVGSSIVTVSGKTASPILLYKGKKLTAKDFVNPDAKKKYNADGTVTLTGKGNFTGTRVMNVRVVAKEDLKKLNVVVDNTALKNKPLVYDGEAKTLDGYFQVFDAQDKRKSTPLKEYSDYAVIYHDNNINAGKAKFTVVGLGDYCGTVTKTYTIKPRVVKKAEDGDMQVNVKDGVGYPFRNGGVTIPDLTVTCDGDVLIPGKDYKVTYSGNKKTCTDNKAKCTISFLGNYRGSTKLVRKFHITPAVLSGADQMNGVLRVVAGDKVYTGRPGAYKSVLYVTVNGILLKSSDYTVSYYKDSGMSQAIGGKPTFIDLADKDSQTVYVKIEGKGNYQGTLTAQYNVRKLTGEAIDLSKAKVTFVGENRAEYTGEGIEPAVEIQYRSNGQWKKMDAGDIGTYVTATYISNVNKGKATVMINGDGTKCVGSKTAVFNIKPKNMQ